MLIKLYKVFQFIWLVSVGSFFLFFVILSQSKPDSPEYSQNTAIWAISIGLGVISYILYLVFRTLSTKDKKKIPSEAIRHGFIATAVCVFGWGALAFSMNALGYTYEKRHPPMVVLSPSPSPISKINFTGQQLWEAVNTYRKKQGLQELILDKNFCNNIVSRWETLKDPNKIGHIGFQEWARKYLPDGARVAEIYAEGNTPQQLINEWNSSPSHAILLNEPSYNRGCSYALNFSGVVELGSY